MATKQEINKLFADMQKKFGETAVVWASDIPVGPPISSGSLALDFAMGYGGFPQNRVVEICGKEGTGKTTLALLTMLNALEKNPHRIAIFLDVEHKITKDWLEMLVGKELLRSRVLYLQPTSIEQATNMYRQAVDSGTVCCAILDSIGGAPTVRRNDDAEVGHYGGNAIGVGEFARAAASMSSAHDCLTIGINQTREDMSGYHALNTPGGAAWKHACVLRVQLKRGKGELNDKVDGETVPVGYTVSAKVVKNQVGAPYRVATWWFCNVQTARYGFGVDTVDETIRLSNLVGVVENKGGWYYHEGLKGGKVNGMAKLIDAIKADPALQKLIAKETMIRLKDHASEVAPIDESETFEEKHSILNRPDQGTAMFADDPKQWTPDQMERAELALQAKFAEEGESLNSLGIGSSIAPGHD